MNIKQLSFSACVLFLSVLSVSGCPKQTKIASPGNGPVEEEPSPSSLLVAPSYELSTLSDESKGIYQEVLGSVVSPCETPETLLACTEAERCGECAYLARVSFRLVRDKMGDEASISQYVSKLSAGREQNKGQSVSLSLENAPVRGPEQAKVQLIEVADFECPHCAKLHQELKTIQPRLDSAVRMYFKNFPLSMHENAEPAARAALAAKKQNKFWEYQNILFSRQDQIEPSRFQGWAKELGLDVDRFLVDYTSSEITQQVSKDREEMIALGVSGTPVLIIDGRPYLDQMQSEAIWNAILFELAQKDMIPYPSAPR